MVEDLVPMQLKRPVCLSMCTLTECNYAITIGHCSIQLETFEYCKSPVASGQRPGGAAGGEAPASSENVVFYSTRKRAQNKDKNAIISWCNLTSPMFVCNNSFEF